MTLKHLGGRLVLVLLAAIAAIALSAHPSPSQTTYPTLRGTAPIVIAHRGASGYRPEHTLAAYELAIAQGADYIEPDLVLTRDRVLVARHDRYLSDSTDIAQHPEFADRRRLGRTSFDTEDRLDWWVEDFTLAELKTLRAVQTRDRDSAWDGQFAVPTFSEVIELVQAKERELGRTIGLYPETKDPEILDSVGLDYRAPLKAILNRYNLNRPDAAIYVQSFHDQILRDFRRDPEFRAPLVQLVWQGLERGWDDTSGQPNYPLEEIATYADGVGAYKRLINPNGRESTNFIRQAHELGLVVHAWTFRNDALPDWSDFPDGPAEIRFYLELGLDGFFTDFPDAGRQAVDS